MDVVVEVKDAPKPSCVAQVVFRYYQLNVARHSPPPRRREDPSGARRCSTPSRRATRLVNTLMTFGLDRRWRRRCGARPATAARRASCSTSRRARATSRANSHARDSAASRPTSASGCSHAGRAMDASASRPTRPGCPFAPAASTAHVRLRAAQLHRPRRHLRRDGARAAPRRTRLAPRGRRARGRDLLRAGFRVWFRHVVPFIGSLLSDRRGLPLPAAVDRLPARRREIVAMLNRAGFAAVNHRRVMGGLSQQFVATRSS